MREELSQSGETDRIAARRSCHQGPSADEPSRPRGCFRFLFVPALLAVPVAAYGQEAPASLDPIATDRPAFTDSSIVVPSGTLQFENGFLDTAFEGQPSTIDFPETLLRFGIASKTELRITAPDYFYGLGSASLGTGFGDVVVGLKQQVGPTLGGFDLSVVLSLSCPSGAKAVSSGGYDPQLQAPWSRQLSANWTAAGMLAVYWPTERTRRNLTGQSTWELDRQIKSSCDAFVEYAGEFPQRGGPANILHFGTACRITGNQQIDFHVGFGLSSAAPDRLIGLGYSFRFRVPGR
jgi:Putative MetA-pathway of phenol degradation